MDKRRRVAVERLQEVAAEDLAAARVCLRAQPALVRIAAFHAQQAAEKQLKAWLTALGDPEPPLIHNLTQLADMIAARGGGTLPPGPLDFLTRFAVGPRYGLGHLTIADAESALAEAEQIADAATRAVAWLTGDDA